MTIKASRLELRLKSSGLSTGARRSALIACALALALGGCHPLPKVGVTPEGETITNEGGASVVLSVTLARRPVESIQVFAVSSNEAEGKVSEPIVLEASSWNQPHSIRVTGVDDGAEDGDIPYEVNVYVRSVRFPHSQPLLVTTLHFVNRDDERASFQALGDLPGGEIGSYAADVSAAGDVVVGWSNGAAGAEAVRWTEARGLVGLGGVDSRANAVSPNGELIVGSVAEESYDRGRAAALWRADAPYELFTMTLLPSGRPTFWFVDAWVVLDDGRAFGTCIQDRAYGDPLGCRYDEVSLLQVIPGSSFIFAADAAGNIGGTTWAERHAPPASKAYYNGATFPFPMDFYEVLCQAPHGCRGEVHDFSQDGAVVVGTAVIPPAGAMADRTELVQAAVRYKGVDGVSRLRNLTDDAEEAGAFAVSTDGRVIGGFASDERGQQAVLWIDGLPNAVEGLVLASGGTLPEGWSLEEVRALSSDARVIVGNGTNADGYAEGFRIVLPSAP